MRKNIIILSSLCFGILGYAQEADSTAKTKEIQEIIIKSQRKKQFSDHASYTFDKEAIAKARHSKDLITSLPELQLDPVSNRVSSIKGGKVLFLINGIEATDMQFSAVAPENVVRVEYFDIVPTRWEGKADTVVNMITRNPENGLTYGIDTMGAFTTGFFDAQAYASHTRGKHDFGIEYAFSLRDYDNRQNHNSYEYFLNNIKYKSTEKERDHFGYTVQDIALRYTYLNPEKETFQAKLNLNIMDNFSKGNGESIFEQGSVSTINKTKEYLSGHYLKPTLDLYYSKRISKKDELVINFVGSMYDNKTYQNNREWVASTGMDIFNNDMSLISKQKSFVGEVAHYHNFGKSKLNTGYRISNNFISNDLTNLSGKSQFDVNYLEQYFYSEISGRKDKLMYRLGVGLTNIHNKSAEATFNDWTFTPTLVLGYSFKNNKTIRLTSSYKPSSPTSSELSPNIIQVAPNITKSGNPWLKNQKKFKNRVVYSYNSKYFDFNTSLYYNNIYNYISRYYILNQSTNHYTLTQRNGNFSELGIEFSGSIKPFGTDILVLQTYLEPLTTKLRLENGQNLKYSSIINSFYLSSKYKALSLRYSFTIPVYQLSEGAFLNRNENASHLMTSYELNNWKFTLGIYWLGIPSIYQNISLKESVVQDNSKTQIFNNKNMFIFGFSYNFSRGKTTDIDKKIENETAEATRF